MFKGLFGVAFFFEGGMGFSQTSCHFRAIRSQLCWGTSNFFRWDQEEVLKMSHGFSVIFIDIIQVYL